MANEFNYSEPGLGGTGGRFEMMVLNGMINNESGLHTPKILRKYALSENTESVPEDQVIPNFDIRNALIYSKVLPGNYSREFVTHEGYYGIEFLVGYEKEAAEWKKARLAEGKDGFQETVNNIDSTVFYVKDAKENAIELTRLNLDVPTLLVHYQKAEEITPAFTQLNRNLHGEITREALFKSLDKMELDAQMALDLQLFTEDVSNRASYYFGDTTVDDIGFWRDKGKRIRAGYDPSMAYRSQRLVEDLLANADPKEYAVAKFPDGTLIFVLSVALSERMIEKYGSEQALSLRWNDSKLMPRDYDPTKLNGFEHAIDPVNPGSIWSANNLFGIATDIEKK